MTTYNKPSREFICGGIFYVLCIYKVFKNMIKELGRNELQQGPRRIIGY